MIALVRKLRPEPTRRSPAAVSAHDTLRRVDRYLGVPLCALATILRRVPALVGFRARAEGLPRRVLFVQLAESGSMVLADPAMREISAVGDVQLFCVTFEANVASLRLTDTIPRDQVFAIRNRSLLTMAIDGIRFLRWCRRQQIDSVVDCELFSRLTAVLCLLTGARRRAGFQRASGTGLYRGDLYTHPVAFSTQRHVSLNYLALVRALVGAARPPSDGTAGRSVELPRLSLRRIGPDELAALRLRLADVLPAQPSSDPTTDRQAAAPPLLLVNANASDLLPQRRWPQSHFAALILEMLAAYPALRVLLIGAASDRPTTAAIAASVDDPRCADIAGRLSLAELPALFARASALLSNDSGPAHFAAVTALPTVVLFGPETPTLFGPLNPNAICLSAGLACSPCVHVNNQRQTRCTDNRCLQAISVDRVREVLARLLEPEIAQASPGLASR